MRAWPARTGPLRRRRARRGDDHAATTPRRATRSRPEMLDGPRSRPSSAPARRSGCAAWCCAPPTSGRSPPAPTSAASRPRAARAQALRLASASSALFRLIGELGKPTIVRRARARARRRARHRAGCDLIVASEEASFGTPEINVGAFPFMIMALIYRNVPRKKANELLLLGERWSAAGGARGGDRQPRRARRGARRGGGRLGGQAGGEVAGDHAPGQGGDAPPARHAARRRARLPARAAHARACPPRTSSRA